MVKQVGLYAMLSDEQKEKALNADFDEGFGLDEYRRGTLVDQSVSINLPDVEHPTSEEKRKLFEGISEIYKDF